MNVFIDSASENLVPELALRADRVLGDRWNGWLRPLSTAEAFGDFLDAWRWNDPNGTWGHVSEVGDRLVYSASDSDDIEDAFPRVARTSDGTALYDLSGWVWVSGAA